MTGSELLLEVGSLLNFDGTDSSANAVTKARIVRALNRAKDRVLARLKFLNIKTSTFSTAASTSLYTPFSDLDQVLVLRQATTDVKLKRYPAWEFYRYFPDPPASGTPTLYYDQLGTNNSGIQQIGLYPIPDATITMNIIYRGITNNLTGAVDYATGTATATNASATVSGSGTTWTAAMEGRYFRIDASQRWYKILTRNSNTSLTLATNFLDTTASGAAYTIAERFNLDGQIDSIDDLICLKAQHIITQGDRQYTELGADLYRDFEKAIQDYKGYMMSHLDDLEYIRSEGMLTEPVRFNAADLSSYDIFQ